MAEPPADFLKALHASPKATREFDELDSANRYAIIYRVQDAKKDETRAKRIATYIAMLDAGQTLHPKRTHKDGFVIISQRMESQRAIPSGAARRGNKAMRTSGKVCRSAEARRRDHGSSISMPTSAAPAEST